MNEQRFFLNTNTQTHTMIYTIIISVYLWLTESLDKLMHTPQTPESYRAFEIDSVMLFSTARKIHAIYPHNLFA